jgi:Amt family ammonium transporter
VCFAAVDVKSKIGYDDSLDVVGVHMVGGIVGALLTGVLASTAINALSEGANIGAQAIAVGAALGFSFAGTWVILWIVDRLVGVRVTEDEEITGLDLTQHAEVGYTLQESTGQPVRAVTIPDTPEEAELPARPSREEAR